MFGMPLVTLTKGSSSNNIYNNQLFLQQAFATHMDSATSNETTVLHQGLLHLNHNLRLASQMNSSKPYIFCLLEMMVQPIKEF